MTQTPERLTEAVSRFKSAIEAMPDVALRFGEGQQFNEWQTTNSDPFVGIGPITNLMSLVDTEDGETAELLVAALRVATAVARQSSAPDGANIQGPWAITPSSDTPNCLRIHGQGAQLCKVYGWSPEEALARAQMIVAALPAPPSSQDKELG